MYFVYTLTIVFTISFGIAFANIVEPNENLLISLRIVINEAMVYDPFMFYANFNASSKEYQYYFNQFIDKLLNGVRYRAIKILVQHQKMLYHIRHSEVLLFGGIEWLEYFYERVANSGNFNLATSVYYIASITTLDEEAISRVFRKLFNMSMVNVILVIQLSSDEIVMVTYYPFTSSSCYSIKPIVFNRFDTLTKQWIHNDFFPNKLHNYYGCPMTCATWEEMPYLALTRNTKDNEIVAFNGFEGKLLEFLSSSLNFTIELYIMNEYEINETYNETGLIFEKIFSTSADFALGGFIYDPNMGMETPYSQTNHYYLSETYIVANIFSNYSIYEKIAYPLQLKVWYAIGLTLLLGSLIIVICERRRKYRNFLFGSTNTTPHYHLYTLAFGANMANTQMPRYNFSRFLHITWFLATLVLRSAYQSGMYEMLRENKNRNPPATIDQVLSQNYEILMKPKHYNLLNNLLDIKKAKNFNASMMEVFDQLATSEKRTAVVTEYEYFGHYSTLNATNWRKLHLVNERIYTLQLAMNVRRQSYLVNEFNKIIATAQYFGFFEKWLVEVELSRKKTRYTLDRSVQTNILTMNELSGLFMILLWLNVMALLLFLAELWCYRYGQKFKTILRRRRRR